MPPAPQRQRILVLDENLNPRLAAEIRSRGREAQSVYHLGYQGLEDPELLRRLAGQYRPEAWILVTGDGRMPFDHAEVIEELEITIATIDPWRAGGYSPDEWGRDVVQHCASVMQEQEAATIRRYSFARHRRWTAGRRQPRT